MVIIMNVESINQHELYITIDSGEKQLSFVKQLVGVMNTFMQRSELDTSYYHCIFLKFYLSDIVNQSEVLEEFMMKKYPDLFYVVIGQKPASGRKVVLEGLLVNKADIITVDIKSDHVLLMAKNYTMIFGKSKGNNVQTVGDETIQILSNTDRTLAQYGASIKDDIYRTWFYINNIDSNYAEFSDVRNAYFSKIGLTKDTHFITSTGIHAKNVDIHKSIDLNYLAYLKVSENQTKYLNALDYLNPTHEYNVSFERGVRLEFNDFYRYFISGTASICNAGHVMYKNDVLKQIERIFVNLSALLNDGDACLDDIKLMIIYLRDNTDYSLISKYLREKLRLQIPYLILEAPVCRPEWLIEIECVGNKKL